MDGALIVSRRLVYITAGALVIAMFCTSVCAVDDAFKQALLELPGAQMVQLVYSKTPADKAAQLRTPMQAKDAERLEKLLGAMSGFLLKQYAKDRPALSRALERQLDRVTPTITVELIDQTAPLFKSNNRSCTSSSNLNVYISSATVDAFVRGGLSAAYRARSDLRPLYRESDGASGIDDLTIAGRFLDMIDQLQRLHPRTLTPLDANLLALRFQQVEGQIVGTFLFPMAHELGHFIAQDQCRPFSCQRDQPAFEEMELMADEFAAALTSIALMRQLPNAAFQNDFDGTFSFIGAATFLSESYERLSKGKDTSECAALVYPSIARRNKHANYAVHRVLLGLEKEQKSDARKALDARVEEIRRKYER